MRWYNTQRDKLPRDEQEVLISVDGINHVATYSKSTESFDVNEVKKKVFKAAGKLIYWTEYSQPE